MEAQLPVLRGLRESPGRQQEPAVSDTTDGRPAVAEPYGTPRERLEAFAAFDDPRLLQSYRLATLILRDRTRPKTPPRRPSPAPGRAGRRYATLIVSTPGSTGYSSTCAATG